VSRQKPVIALKVGRFKSGRQAVASHTGALAGAESAFNAAFRRAGVIRAETSEELFDWARALAWCPPPKGRRVAVLTNAGGPGVTAADALEANGLQMATLQEKTLAALREALPAAASLHNPVDMLASATPMQYAKSLHLLLEDQGVDSVLVIVPPPPMYTTAGVARAMIPIIYAADKPVVVALMGERLIQEAVEHFRAARVPEYRFPERAAGALAILAQRAEYLQQEDDAPLAPADVDPQAVRDALARQTTDGGVLDGETLEAICAAYGICTPASVLARSADEAARTARNVGFPVALKIASPHIAHKSDVDGVLLGVPDEAAVRRGFATLLARARAARPEAQVDGVLVQEMVGRGQEVIAGVVQDAQFGPLLMFGSGGVEVEGVRDVAFALAPLTACEARELLERTWAGRRLGGYRNIPPADRDALLDTLARLGRLAADFPELGEVEINPLRVMAPGEGVRALDVRARLGKGVAGSAAAAF
jgi:acetyltransferase